MRRASPWITLGLFVATLILYLWALAPGLVRGDGGELQYILAIRGVAHPTGYPLYTLFGWLWTKLIPFGSIAWRINLLSAVCGAGAVTLVCGIVYRLTRRSIPALTGALFLALSPAFWTLSSVTEVYALHALFVAAILYLLLVWRDATRRRFHFLVLTAFVYGLSLSHHRTMVLLAPAMLLFVLLVERPKRSIGWVGHLTRHCLVLALAFLAGLLPYLHIFVYHLSRGRTVQDIVVNVILGGDFAGFLGLRSDLMGVLWELPRQQLGVLGLIAAAAGLVWLFWKQRNVAWLLTVAYLANAGFCLFYRVPDIPDFTLPIALILAVWAGASAGFLSQLGVGDRSRVPPVPSAPWRLRGRASVRLGLELLLLVVATLSFRHLPQVQAGVASRDGDIEAQGRALLAYPFEPGATMIADWDLAMAVRFLRNVEGVRGGVRVSSVRLGREKGCDTLRLALESGQAVYVAPAVQLTRLPDGYQFEAAPPYLKISSQIAPYTRVDRPIDPDVTLEGVQRHSDLLVLRWLVTGSRLAADYTTYVHYFDAAGQPIGQQDKGMGAELSCWYPPTSWPPGEVIQDLYIAPAGTATVRVGMYVLVDGQVQGKGDAPLITLP
jgi:Protein O-mannosyl-transferase TMEM260-like